MIEHGAELEGAHVHTSTSPEGETRLHSNQV